MLIEGGLLCEAFIAGIALIGFLLGVGAPVSLETVFRCVFFATDLMLDGIYYKFANISFRRFSLFIRITYWAIEC